MGDAPLAYVEGASGVRVAEDEIVAVGKNDVRLSSTTCLHLADEKLQVLSFKVGR